MKEGAAEAAATLWMSGEGPDSRCPGRQEGHARRGVHFCVCYLVLFSCWQSSALCNMIFSALMSWDNSFFQADSKKADDVVCVAAPSCIQRL